MSVDFGTHTKFHLSSRKLSLFLETGLTSPLGEHLRRGQIPS